MLTTPLVHGTRPLLRTVMEVGRDWALMSDGDGFVVWRVAARDRQHLAVASVVKDLGLGRCLASGSAIAYREAEEEGEMLARFSPSASGNIPWAAMSSVRQGFALAA